MDIGLLIVRVVFGLLFAAHGSQKLFGWFRGYGLSGTGAYLEGIGFRPGRLFAAADGVAESAGGLLLALGLLQPVAAAVIVSVMVVAIVTVHIGNGLLVTSNGIELPLLYVATAVALALTGPGDYSLDAILGLDRLWTPELTWIVLAVGAVSGFGSLAMRRPAAAGVAHA